MAGAQAQPPPMRMEIVHCFVSQPTYAEEPERACRPRSFFLRGLTRASEPGGPIDGAATRRVGFLLGLGQTPPAIRGSCGPTTSAEGRVVLEWTLQAGQGTGAFAVGMGRFEGETGYRRAFVLAHKCPQAPAPASAGLACAALAAAPVRALGLLRRPQVRTKARWYGEVRFERLPPVPAVEPGVFRACNRTVGEFRLP